MKHAYATWLAALGLAACYAGPAQAQQLPRPQQNQFQRPAVSPYLNLARPGNPGVNYYGLVRPQVDFNQQLQYLQQNQLGANNLVDELAAQDGYGYSFTGRSTAFGNLGRYFSTPGGGVRPMTVPVAGIRKQ